MTAAAAAVTLMVGGGALVRLDPEAASLLRRRWPRAR